MAGQSPRSCDLCGAAGLKGVVTADARTWFYCAVCELVHVSPQFHPSQQQQGERYARHQNSRSDAGYVAMLERVIARLLAHCPDARRVLDYGSGPTPVLVDLLLERGLQARGFDPLYAPQPPADLPCDAITAVETFEHFAAPAAELRRIDGWLRDGGVLVVQTLFHQGPDAIANWWYARDRTHIAFYSDATWRVAARLMNWDLLESDGVRTVVFRRQVR